MSRIGNKSVTLPKGVSFDLRDGRMFVKGPKGELSRHVVDGVSFDQEDGTIRVARASNSPSHRANHGLTRALLANMVVGVSTGFSKELKIIGVGYKAEIKGSNRLLLNLGYSHPIDFEAPKEINLSVAKDGTITVAGADKETVGQVAAEIRGFRPPDSYKGKGVRYANEHVRLKAGKSGL